MAVQIVPPPSPLELLAEKEAESTARYRGVLNQIANNELATEVAPYLENRPLAQIGFDANRVSMLPTYLPEDAENYKGGHPADFLYGEYASPGRRKEKRAWKKALLQAYGITEDQFDRMFIYQHPTRTKTRERLLETLAHEAEHRGRRILHDTEQEKEDTAETAMDAIEISNPKWYKDPNYDRLYDIRFPPKGRPTRTTHMPQANEIATRISDLLTSSNPKVKDASIRHLRSYFLNREHGSGINPETYEPYHNPHADVPIRTYFNKRPLFEDPETGGYVEDPETGGYKYDEGPGYGKQIPLETYKRLLNYNQEKQAAEEWLKARRGFPRNELIKRLVNE